MDASIKGKILSHGPYQVSEGKLDELITALATENAAATASLVPCFGPVLDGGEQPFVEKIGLDFSRALLGGIDYEWARPFAPGEEVDAKVFIEDAYEKSGMVFAVVTSEFTDQTGTLVQRHRATFIERGAA